MYLYKDLEPDLTLTAQTVAYLEVSANEAERLKEMPTVVTNYAYKKLDGTYILPPMLYPDGKYYLKLGHHNAFERIVHTPEQMKSWYIGTLLRGTDKKTVVLCASIRSLTRLEWP
jgi:sarcosine oxidase/L-pipecolate oxidase